MNTSFQLIDSGWDKIIGDAVATSCAELRVICPFIKVRTAKRLLANKCPELIHVITRFHLGEMCDGVNDTAALRLLLENGARIRGIRGLHAKLYLFGDQRSVVTSANLTEAAMLRNHEFGFVSDDKEVMSGCRDYFGRLWDRAGNDLTLECLTKWEWRINEHLAKGGRPTSKNGLGDEGSNAEQNAEPFVLPASGEASQQGFVKFLGEGDNRANVGLSVLNEVRSAGCHWACSYPENKRPRRVQDGAVMFMGRLMENPNDTIIFGRAIGMRHIDSRDVATAEEIEIRPWKVGWPNYIRVHHGEFLAGTLGNGIRLSELMDTFKADSFASTQRNDRQGGGNTDPRKAFQQQAAVELTPEAIRWLNERLEEAFSTCGKLSPANLEMLDWPVLPARHLEMFQEWLETSQGRKSNTAREYVYFLKRCMEHYDLDINPQTVPNEAAADVVIEQVSRVVNERGRWKDGTFDERDVRQNLRPALRAFGRFSQNFRSGS